MSSTPTLEADVKQILDTILSGTATTADFAALEIPESYRGITVHKDEQEMFAGKTTWENIVCSCIKCRQ